ncbi:hypothetical protein UB46_02285 [Burkholderiaceae bacterium 16]|nr:hypothetical protein UB46_02285 [Burkholderiaceae bacterium 16]
MPPATKTPRPPSRRRRTRVDVREVVREVVKRARPSWPALPVPPRLPRPTTVTGAPSDVKRKGYAAGPGGRRWLAVSITQHRTS